MVTENFTQFCVRNHYTSEWDIVDHAALSPSGHCSNHERANKIKALDKRMTSNKLAHREYEAAILKGEIVDPSSEYTIEELKRQQQAAQDKIKNDKIGQLENRIHYLSDFGKGKTGKIRPSYQREIDKCKAELILI